jgi:hypothetical protein
MIPQSRGRTSVSPGSLGAGWKDHIWYSITYNRTKHCYGVSRYEVGKVGLVAKYHACRYVATKHSKRGTELDVEVRGKRRKATVTKMPFVPTRYWRGEGVPLQ